MYVSFKTHIAFILDAFVLLCFVYVVCGIFGKTSEAYLTNKMSVVLHCIVRVYYCTMYLYTIYLNVCTDVYVLYRFS